jgi:hypothetical protein
LTAGRDGPGLASPDISSGPGSFVLQRKVSIHRITPPAITRTGTLCPDSGLTATSFKHTARRRATHSENEMGEAISIMIFWAVLSFPFALILGWIIDRLEGICYYQWGIWHQKVRKARIEAFGLCVADRCTDQGCQYFKTEREEYDREHAKYWAEHYASLVGGDNAPAAQDDNTPESPQDHT